MNEFLSSIKIYFNSSKEISFLLINTFQIQIIVLMFMGTGLQFFKALEFFSEQNTQNLRTINISFLAIHLIVFFLILWQIYETRSQIKRENIKKITANFIKCYKNILMIPIFYLSFYQIKINEKLETMVIPVINILIGSIFCYIKGMCCLSNRFRVMNYFSKFGSTFADMFFMTLIIAVTCFQGSHYGAIVMVFKNIFRVTRLYFSYEEHIVQKVMIFYNLYQISICTMIIAAQFLEFDFKENISFTITVLFFGAIIIGHITEIFSMYIYTRIISASSLFSMEEQVDIIQQNQQGLIKKHFNQIRVMTMIYLQRQKYDEKEENQFGKWWQFFNRKVLIHKINCNNPKCKCEAKKLPDSDIQIFLKQLITDIRRLSLKFNKEVKLKIMTIYMYIEILRKPLKAYYELMRLKSQRKSESFDIQLSDLSTQTRECFDQLFLKNKVKNQKLQLIKVIEFQQYVQQCESDLKKIITETMQFYSNFNYNTIKISQIKEQSNNLQKLKVSFENKLLKILNDYSSNLKITVLIHLFYNYIEVYQNKQAQLKKISHQQLFKKRIFDKKQINVFSPQYGSIFIDLVQERGKIKNLTKNMCANFGYPKQDMVNFNVNLFMPRLFGKHHAKFLHNFIEKGKFKLLKESFRSIFGKNKKKFLFPMKISLKAEYLQDNFFGSSSLLRPIETFSEFIIVDRYGKIEEMTEGIYKKIFMPAFSDQNQKVSRLHINKLIPSYNVLIENSQQKGTSYDRIIQGTFMYCDDSNYLIEKFKFIKDFNKSNKVFSTTNGKNANQNDISVNDVSNSTLIYSKEEQEINLNDAMKHFLLDLEMFSLRAVKVAYKVTPVVTAQFEAELLEIVSIKGFSSGHVQYQTLLDQLINLLDIFSFHLDDRQLIRSHFNQLQMHLDSKEYESQQTQSFTTTQHQIKNSMHNLMGPDAPRQVKKAAKITQQEIESVQFEDNILYDEELQLAQKASVNNSVFDSAEGDSKRQILVNAFSNGEKKIINSRFSKIAYLAIFILIALLVSLLIQSMVYVNLLIAEWKSISHVAEMKNILEYRKSLIEIDEYRGFIESDQQLQSINNKGSFDFIQGQIQSLNDKFKYKVQTIYDSVVKEHKFNQLYTQQFLLSSSVETQQSEPTSFMQLAKQILWRFSYSAKETISFLRSYYESITLKFSVLLQNQQQFLLQTQQQNLFALFIINIVYLILIILVGLGVLPIFLYFKNEEKTMIELLQYISFTQLKKSLRKLNLIQSQLNKLDRIDNFDHMKNEFKTNFVLLSKDLNNNNNEQSLNVNKSPRIVASSNNDSTRFLTKSIFVGILIMLFLSNLSIWTTLQLSYVSREFRESVKVNQMIYKMQGKPAMLVNVYLMNVNKLIIGVDRVEITANLEKQIGHDYFTPQTLLSQPQNKKLSISERLFHLFEQSMCMYIDPPCEISNQLTFNYLVYLFRNKFQFLSQEKNSLLVELGRKKNQQGQKMINQWILENKIEKIVDKISEVIQVSEKVNEKVFSEYERKFNANIYVLIAIGVVLIVFNAIVLLIVQHFTFDHFNSVLKQTQNVFRHFDLDTLCQNTYLTSYFNAKIKDSK